MLVGQAVEAAKKLTGSAVDDTTAVRWLSELDGRLAMEFYRADVWTPYDPTDDLQCALLIPFPWDGGVYTHHLAALTYHTNGEYDRYENERVLAEAALDDFRKYMQRLHQPVCKCILNGDGGTKTTVISGCADNAYRWRWLSAYALAVLHGFEGTEEEWLASLKGEKGDPGEDGQDGVDGTVSWDELTPEQRASLKGEKGDPGTPRIVLDLDVYNREALLDPQIGVTLTAEQTEAMIDNWDDWRTGEIDWVVKQTRIVDLGAEERIFLPVEAGRRTDVGSAQALTRQYTMALAPVYETNNALWVQWTVFWNAVFNGDTVTSGNIGLRRTVLGTLPSTTASDNDAVLQVDSGAWAKGLKIWTGTQAEYDLLTPDAGTLYIIEEASS